MFYLVKWAEINDLFKTNRFNSEHMCLISIQFGLGHFKHLINDSQVWFQEINDKEAKEIVINDRIGGFGRLFILFMGFLASRNFRNIQTLDFESLIFDVNSFFQQNEWHLIHEVGFKFFVKKI